ncbi:MAG: flagellar biosynthetic protein FliQ [Nitriliruptor sp.]|uniref:flagellar biosynthetic protein FliQ n=1 Tax=Nitriliruptor sp. TaxID=2448056 RepID=UPI0034A0406E
MTDAQVIEILTGAIEISTKLAGPLLLVSLVLGVVISVIQTVTQIQEMTLTFVPKLVGVALILIVAGSWMMRELVGWVTTLWQTIPTLG